MEPRNARTGNSDSSTSAKGASGSPIPKAKLREWRVRESPSHQMRTPAVIGLLTGAAAVPGFVLLPFPAAVAIYGLIAFAGAAAAVRAINP